MARDKKSGPERTAEAIDVLRQWQGIERDAIETTAQIMEKTDNLLIRQIMEIIRNDSVQHHRVQQFLIDSMTKTPITLQPEELAEVWGQIEAHDELERQTIELAKNLRAQSTSPVANVLIDYLLRDEEKHDTLLGDLEQLKQYMSKLS
jgi:rubrerythrin